MPALIPAHVAREVVPALPQTALDTASSTAMKANTEI